MQVREKAGFVRREIGGMLLGIKVDLPEREKWFGLEQVGMRLKKGLQIGVGWFDTNREII